MTGTAHGLTLLVFAAVLAVTLAVTWWASRRTRTATEFWAAGRGITGLQNGFAIAGDWLSASSFLGFAGITFLYGFDGLIFAITSLATFVPVLLLLAARMRNTGRFTIADVLSFRMRERPTRTAVALSTIVVCVLYLIAQMVGAGVLFGALAGLPFWASVLIAGGFMLIYVLFGGMLATTWVQVIKAVLLMAAIVLLTILVLAKVGFDPTEVIRRAVARSGQGGAYLQPGNLLSSPLDVVSLGVVDVLAAAGLPHILMRLFTVPDARQARSSAGWAIALIGAFYVLIVFLGLGARALLGPAGVAAAGTSGNLAAPMLAKALSGDVLLAVVAAIAFTTILAVTAGLAIAASSAVAHDLWTNVLRRGEDAERSEPVVGRVAAGAVAVLAMALAIAFGKGFNVSILTSFALSVAASANFPALLLALLWRRFTTAGAIVGVTCGAVSALVLILLGPLAWPGGAESAPFPLEFPVLVSVPLGFAGCVVGTLLSRDRLAEERFPELRVRAELGLGAEA
jgi:cation/acetate symporter